MNTANETAIDYTNDLNDQDVNEELTLEGTEDSVGSDLDFIIDVEDSEWDDALKARNKRGSTLAPEKRVIVDRFKSMPVGKIFAVPVIGDDAKKYRTSLNNTLDAQGCQGCKVAIATDGKRLLIKKEAPKADKKGAK